MIAELMDRFIEFASTWLWLVLLAAWRALPILVIAVVFALVLRRKLSPALHALLLTLVLIRLLLPISIGSPASFQWPINDLLSSQHVSSVKQAPQPYHQASSYLPNVDRADSTVEFVPAKAQPIERAISWEELLGAGMLLLVIAVSIGLIFRSFLSHVRFALRLRSCRRLDDQPLIDLLLRECDQLGVGRRPAVREVGSLAAPAVFGLLRKTICLPPRLAETLSEQEMRWVIRHELAHIRRHDIPIAMVATIATAFHWFNPVVWMVVSRLRATMEAAADRLALQCSSPHEVSQYGDLLLRFAQDSMTARKSPTLGLISFASGKHLKQRVELLVRNQHPTGWTTKYLPTTLAVALGLAGLTDAREVTEQPLPELHLIANESARVNDQPYWLNPRVTPHFDVSDAIVTETYDVHSIFETMPKSLKDAEKTPLEQLNAWIHFPPEMQDRLHLNGDTLSARLTGNQHHWLKHTLDAWKNGEPAQICIESRIMQTNIHIASSIDWTGRRIEGLTVRGLGPAIAARIDEAELAQFVRTVTGDRTSNLLFAPKVTLFDGQQASIADQVNRPFVTGVDPLNDGCLQPVVSLVDEGISFHLEPKRQVDGSITLAFEVRSSSIGKVSYANLPIKTLIDSKSQFTVQVPATEQYAVSSSVKLNAGESVVVAIPRVFDHKPGADSETTLVVALTPRILEIEKQPSTTAQDSKWIVP